MGDADGDAVSETRGLRCDGESFDTTIRACIGDALFDIDAPQDILGLHVQHVLKLFLKLLAVVAGPTHLIFGYPLLVGVGLIFHLHGRSQSGSRHHA